MKDKSFQTGVWEKKDVSGGDGRPTEGYESNAEGWVLRARLQCVGEVLKKIGGVADECVEYPKAPAGTNTCSTTSQGKWSDLVRFRIEHKDLKLDDSGDGFFLRRDLVECK